MNANIQEIFRKNTTRIKSIAFHPKQSSFITGNHCGMIYIWDLDFSMIVEALSEHQGSVRCISFHPSGELFASCGDDKIVRVWNYKTRSVVMRLKGHSDFVRSVNFHPTQPLVVSGSDDHSVIVWNYYSGEIVKSEIGHNHYVMSTVFLDADTIASASLDHTICVWRLGDLNSKYVSRLKLHQTVSAHERGINSLFYKSGVLVSGADDKDVKTWKYRNGNLEQAKVFYASEGNVTCAIYNDGEIMAVTEDGQLNIYEEKHCVKIEHGSRLWAVATKKNYVIVGSDDGLVVYSKKINTVGTEMGNNLFYYNKNRLMCYNMDKHKAREWCGLKENVARIRPGRESSISSVIVEYAGQDNKSDSYIEYFANKHDVDNEIISNKDSSSKYGQCGYVNGVCYELRNNCLYKDGEKWLDDVEGILATTKQEVFVLNGNKVRNELGLFTLPFKPLDVVGDDDETAFIGRNEIVFYDRKMRQKLVINERVEITGGLYAKNNDEQLIFIYGTLRNVKYVYGGTGMLLSVDEYLKPIGFRNNELYLLDGSGIRRIAVNTTEILFRKVVLEDGDIIGFIKKNNLPGISSLKYLVEHGKGAVALPYINDPVTKFDLFISSGEFESAYEICFDDKMRDKLAFEAMAAGNYKMAEICWDQIGSIQSLFYLYLCTNQMDKVAQFKDKNTFAAILCEDKTCLNNLFEFSGIASNLDNLSVTEKNKNDNF